LSTLIFCCIFTTNLAGNEGTAPSHPVSKTGICSYRFIP